MHVITEKGATVMLDGRPRLIPKSHPQWAAIHSQLRADNLEGVRRLVDPAATFTKGDQWRTRSGGVAVVLFVKDDHVMVEVDECFEVETITGNVTPGRDHEDDLIERIET